MKSISLVSALFITLILLLQIFPDRGAFAQTIPPKFKIVVLTEKGGQHGPFVDSAKSWLAKLAADSNLAVDYIENTDRITESFLDQYRLFIQLNYPPYSWTKEAASAFEKYITEGKGGGWIGLHHATLLGEFDGYPMWQWFSKFMGGIRFKNYIAQLTSAAVKVEDRSHPCMASVPDSFTVSKDEWYTYDKDPRENVRVLASADESTYDPPSDIKMGDHPVVWTNEAYKARNIYIFMGHHPNLFQNKAYTALLRNSIFWAASAESPAEKRHPAPPVIYYNNAGYDLKSPKAAVIGTDSPFKEKTGFAVVSSSSSSKEFTGTLDGPYTVKDWDPGKTFYRADFSSFSKPGKYRLKAASGKDQVTSGEFVIGENALAELTIPSILHYYNKQRANTAIELEADSKLRLYGSNKTVDIRGGWCDASGDVSKYFSHLSYTNFMSPQQGPLVTWSLAGVAEAVPGLLEKLGLNDSIRSEALWGADYLLRSLSDEGYFYETIFSYFKTDPGERRVVGLLANSVTTSDYQAAFREGGGMAIAALARISKWNVDGSFKSAQYLEGAERAFAHLLKNNLKYCDDGKENIIDDYCALMAAGELWIATDNPLYRDEARKRAGRLCSRMSPYGYFISDDSQRPFWHASDAGLPVIALCRYLKKESDSLLRSNAINTIKKALEYNLRVTYSVSNPFGYARQSFMYRGKVREGFFIPHENESGWWWQGENARLASLAAAALAGVKLVCTASDKSVLRDSLSMFAWQQVSWILGCNPYSMCFMYKLGENNVPYMSSNFGHGSERGGISNGITGKVGNADGSGIDFKTSAEGNEWRWTEQWLPHAAWFLQAITEISFAGSDMN